MRSIGGGNTPPAIVEILKKAIAEKGLLIVAAESGIGKSNINRYARGLGEPTTASLEKLAAYFKVSVAELRGDYASALAHYRADQAREDADDGSYATMKLNNFEHPTDMLRRLNQEIERIPSYANFIAGDNNIFQNLRNAIDVAEQKYLDSQTPPV